MANGIVIYHSRSGNTQIMAQTIADSIEYAENNGVGLVFGNQASGMTGAFSAGGDLGYMGSLAKAKKWGDIDKMIKDLHELIMEIKLVAF